MENIMIKFNIFAIKKNFLRTKLKTVFDVKIFLANHQKKVMGKKFKIVI